MPRYELALILKAMRRVSDLPSDRVPARARPAASRPPSPACPACWTPGPLARSAGGRGRQGGARGSGARRGRVRAGGGGCVPARSREGVCNARSGPGGGAGLGPPALRSPMEGLREDTRARTQAGPALRPRVEKLLVVPAGRSSRSPELRVRDQYSLLPPKRTSADWVPTHLSPLSHLKKNLLTFLFLTPAEILLRVPLAQFYSSKLWPCLCFPKTFPSFCLILR